MEKQPHIVTYLRFFYIIVVTSLILSITNIISMTFLNYGEYSRELSAGTFIFRIEITTINEYTIYTNFCFNALLIYILFVVGLLVSIIFARNFKVHKVINIIALILSGICFIASGFLLIFFKEAIIPQITDPFLVALLQVDVLGIHKLPIAYISGVISILAGFGFIGGIPVMLNSRKQLAEQ